MKIKMRWNVLGYVVVVYKNGRAIHRYAAGNDRLESSGVVSPASDFALTLDEIEAYCKSTAKEMAEEYGAEIVPGNTKHLSWPEQRG